MNCQIKGSFFSYVVKNVQSVIYMMTVSLALAGTASFAVHAYDVGVKNPATDRAASAEASTVTPYATNARGSQANIQVFGARSRAKISYDIHKYAGKKGLPVVGQNGTGSPGTLITDVTTKSDELDPTVVEAADNGSGGASIPVDQFASLFRPTPVAGSGSPSFGGGFSSGGSTVGSSGGSSTGESASGGSTVATSGGSSGGANGSSGGSGGFSVTPSQTLVLAQVPVVGTGALLALALPLLMIVRVRRSK